MLFSCAKEELREKMIWYIIILRFFVTFIFALLFGMERQRSHKPIGFGTFIFVSIGSCALAITALNLEPENPLPLLSAIVTGIGFLGAGALIRTSDKIFGFTTAASIWAFAIFGLLIGTGSYLAGFILYLLIWIDVIIDKHLEKMGIGSYQKKIVINTNKIVNEKEIIKILLLTTKKFKIISIEFDRKNNKLSLTFLVEGTRDQINKIPRLLMEKDWFDSCKAE